MSNKKTNMKKILHIIRNDKYLLWMIRIILFCIMIIIVLWTIFYIYKFTIVMKLMQFIDSQSVEYLNSIRL